MIWYGGSFQKEYGAPVQPARDCGHPDSHLAAVAGEGGQMHGTGRAVGGCDLPSLRLKGRVF